MRVRLSRNASVIVTPRSFTTVIAPRSAVRAKVILGFPYSILYEIVDDEILVASIAYHFQHPDAHR